jgi:hypothetical protein
MKRIAFALAFATLCGCTANLGMQIGSTGRSATAPTVGPGSSFSSSGVGVRFGDMPGIGSLIGAVGLGWLFGRDTRMDAPRIQPAMDAHRRVVEQDCSQALPDPGANLRCR